MTNTRKQGLVYETSMSWCCVRLAIGEEKGVAAHGGPNLEIISLTGGLDRGLVRR